MLVLLECQQTKIVPLHSQVRNPVAAGGNHGPGFGINRSAAAGQRDDRLDIRRAGVDDDECKAFRGVHPVCGDQKTGFAGRGRLLRYGQ